MLTRDRQRSPLNDEPPQITALKDLTDFLAATDLPPVSWHIGPTPMPSVDAIIQPGPAQLLKIVQAYAEAINVPTAQRRLNELTQEFVAYRSDALGGRTEMYVAIRTPIDCLDAPPGAATLGTLIAERDWETIALVEFAQATPARSITSTPFQYERGQAAVMHQHGRRGMPVDTKWWSTLDINEAWIVDDSAVTLVDLIEYTSPISAWADELTRKVDLNPVAVDDTAAQILTGPWRPEGGE